MQEVSDLTQAEAGTADVTSNDEGQEQPQAEAEAEAEAPAEEEKAVDDPNANVRLAKSAEGKALPKGLCNFGMLSADIPHKAQQLKGFHVEEAGAFVAQYPQYKFLEKKGEKTQQIKLQ